MATAVKGERNIGKVIQVQDDEAFGERRAIIDPFVTPGELREVLVLK